MQWSRSLLPTQPNYVSAPVAALYVGPWVALDDSTEILAVKDSVQSGTLTLQVSANGISVDDSENVVGAGRQVTAAIDNTDGTFKYARLTYLNGGTADTAPILLAFVTYTPAAGGGLVDSVNGQTGVVVLTAADVGAIALGAAVTSVNGEGPGAVNISAADVGAIALGAALLLTGGTMTGAITRTEQVAPAAPAANNLAEYAVDDGSGATVLAARFPTGGQQWIARQLAAALDGDVVVGNAVGTRGLVQQSPDGTAWRLTLDNTGAPTFTSL